MSKAPRAIITKLHQRAALGFAIVMVATACGSSSQAESAQTAAPTTAPATSSSTSSETTMPSTIAPTSSTEAEIDEPDPFASASNGDGEDEPTPTLTPFWESPSVFINGWAYSAGIHLEQTGVDISPTVTPEDVVFPDDSPFGVLAEPVTAGSALGALLNPDSGEVVAVLGTSDPESGELSSVFMTTWSSAHGIGKIPAFGDVFDADEIVSLSSGESLYAEFEGLGALFQAVEGAEANDPLLIFTITDARIAERDPLHDSVVIPIFDQLAKMA